MRRVDLIPLKDPPRWSAFLAEHILTAGIEIGSEGRVDAGTRRLPIDANGQPGNPLEFFLASIPAGIAEASKRYCPHVHHADPLILARNHAHWNLACYACTQRELRRQDTRCDWCGGDRPDRAETWVYAFDSFYLVAQFCPLCTSELGLSLT